MLRPFTKLIWDQPFASVFVSGKFPDFGNLVLAEQACQEPTLLKYLPHLNLNKTFSDGVEES